MIEHIKMVISILFSFACLLLFHWAFPVDILVSTSCVIATVGIFFFIMSYIRCLPKGWRVTFSNLGTLIFLIATAIILGWGVQREYDHDQIVAMAFAISLVLLANFALSKNKLNTVFNSVFYGENAICNYENSINGNGVKLAVISDLHIPQHSLLEGNIDPNIVVKNVYDALISITADNPDYIIILGDITDTGHIHEWEKFMKLPTKQK